MRTIFKKANEKRRVRVGPEDNQNNIAQNTFQSIVIAVPLPHACRNAKDASGFAGLFTATRKLCEMLRGSMWAVGFPSGASPKVLTYGWRSH